MKRYARRTIGFCRKLENHCAMLAVWMFAYNLCRRPHRSLQGATLHAVEPGRQAR